MQEHDETRIGMELALGLVVGTVLTALVAVVCMIVLASSACAHEAHEATSPEQARVYEFYNTWMRPTGSDAGIAHRAISCCNKQDCSRVLATRRNKQTQWLEVQVCMENEVCDPDRWYPVDPAHVEENQPDPRESPDGAAHACVIGGKVRCYVGGGGI